MEANYIMAFIEKMKYPIVSVAATEHTPDYKTAISEGRFEGYELVNKFAYSTEISPGAFKVLSNNLNIIHEIPSERQMKVVATNAADCITGTGMRSVIIKYLNQACELKYEYLELDAGLTTNTIATDIYRIEYIYGGSYGSNGSFAGATGTITLENLAGTEVYGQISQYSMTNEACIHWIRPGYRSIFSEVKIESSASHGVFVGIFSTTDFSGFGGDEVVTVQCCGIEIGGGNVSVVAINPHFGLYNSSTKIQSVFFGVQSRSGIPNLQGSGSFVLYEFLADDDIQYHNTHATKVGAII